MCFCSCYKCCIAEKWLAAWSFWEIFCWCLLPDLRHYYCFFLIFHLRNKLTEPGEVEQTCTWTCVPWSKLQMLKRIMHWSRYDVMCLVILLARMWRFYFERFIFLCLWQLTATNQSNASLHKYKHSGSFYLITEDALLKWITIKME